MSSTPKPRSRNGRTAPARGAVAVMLRSMQVGQLVIAAVLVVIGAVRAIADGSNVVAVLAVSLDIAGG